MLVVAGALVLLAVLGVGAFLFLRGGGEGSASPEDTVRELFTSAKNGDCETVADLVTDDFFDDVSSRDETLAVCQGYVEAGVPGWIDDYTVDSVTLRFEDETTASVSARLDPGPGSEAPPGWLVFLVNGDDDVWRVEHAEIVGESDLADASESSDDAAATDDSESDSGGGGSAAAPDTVGEPTPPPTGAESHIDRMAESCYQGNMAACDELFLTTFEPENPQQSSYEEHTGYGATCGGRFTGDVDEYCETLIPDSGG